MKKKGILYVITAPSGTGKGTILKRLLKRIDSLRYSVSTTTRPIRKGEKEGKSYHFIKTDEFKKLIENDELIEWTEYCDNYYGTPKINIEKSLDSGYDIVLEIETEGAESIKKIYPDCVMIFILPPSIQELERRIRKRASEENADIEKRIMRAKEEIKHCEAFDYIVINDNLDHAVDEMECIIVAEKQRTIRNLSEIKKITDK
jgi:guanylate kinase